MHRLGSGIAFGLTFLASLVAGAREAYACSPPPDGWFFTNLAGSTPVNGALVLHYVCYTSCEDEPDPETFVLKTTAGETVAGSVVLSGTSNANRFLVFRPESGALEVDGTYTAEMEGIATPFGYLTIVPEITWKTEFTVTDEFFAVDQPHGEIHCCPGPIDSCGGTPCFRTEVDRKPAVSVTWDDGSTPESAQYAYRFLLDGDESDVPWSWNGASAGFELGMTQTSACYVLELQRLSDGFVHRFDERCLDRPEDFEPGVHPAPPNTILGVLASCDAPPDGYKAQWCGVRADLCTPSDDPWCENYVEICLDGGGAGAPNVGGGSGTSGSAGSASGSAGAGSGGTEAGTGGTGEAGAPDTGEAGGDGGGERVYSKGCGCAVPGTGTSSPATFALAMFGLVTLGLRRRNRH